MTEQIQTKVDLTPEGALKAAGLLAEGSINGTRDSASINAGISCIKTMLAIFRLQLDVARFKAKNPEVPIDLALTSGTSEKRISVQ